MNIGANTAILDAVVLANEIYEIANNVTGKSVKNAFSNYYNKRFPASQHAFNTSQRFGKILSGQVNIFLLFANMIK
jgi:2-polyprenyl-6-methoxyphenol hydroxylase-like FAD-dependent oxidoreductase